MSAITTRKIQRDQPLGSLITTLPIEWVRYVETKHNDTLKVVEMFEKDDCLVIQPAFSRQAQYHDEDREGPFMGKREYRPYKYRPIRRIGSQVRDSQGHVTIGYLRKVYRSGLKSRVVSLPREWVMKHQKRVKEDLHRVDITIRDELWLKPHFRYSPRMIHGVPIPSGELPPEIAGEPPQPTAKEPQPADVGPLTPAEAHLMDRLVKNWDRYKGQLHSNMTAKQRRLLKKRY